MEWRPPSCPAICCEESRYLTSLIIFTRGAIGTFIKPSWLGRQRNCRSWGFCYHRTIFTHENGECQSFVKVLLLHKYGPKAASFRYRFQQYLPYLESNGLECTVSSLLDDDYLTYRFDTGRISVRPVFRAFARRLSDLVHAHRYDLVIIYCELLPYFPAVLERYLEARKIPYIVDLDDAIFHSYDQSEVPFVRWLLGGKIKKVIQGASCVFAGSRYLADYSRQQNSNVVILPTVIDLNRYERIKKVEQGLRKPFTIGWIGSPSTSLYLESIGHVLRKFCEQHDARVVLVGSGNIQLPEVPVEFREWAEATEISDLLEFDVGIMPLSDSPWSRGKCGFKLIQYMACGLPVIASPVGVNVDIVDHGQNGFLAGTEQQWLEALNTLWKDPELRGSMGAAGRQRIEAKYSVQVTAPIVVQKVRDVALPVARPALRQSRSVVDGALTQISKGNIDIATVKGFGDEWSRFDQSKLTDDELIELFGRYFHIFPWDRLAKDAQGFDLGCGTGRWRNASLRAWASFIASIPVSPPWSLPGEISRISTTASFTWRR